MDVSGGGRRRGKARLSARLRTNIWRIEMEKKTFAFKLADVAAKGGSKWNARDGIALAGCSEVRLGNYREATRYGDNGIYC
jgi:hypothetical protein